MADYAYYSNDASDGGGDYNYNYSSDSSGVGGGGPDAFGPQTSDFGPASFNAPGDITGMGFGGAGQGPGGPGGYFFGAGGGSGGFNAPGDITGMGYRGVGGNYAGYAGAGSLGNLANAAMGGGAGLGGIPGDITGLGFGDTGTAGSFGIPPALAGGTAFPTLQSSLDINQPSPITAGAQDQGAPQPSAPGGELSGAGPSMWDQLAGILGGLNPISSAQAAETSQAASQNTLTTGDVQSSPFLGPWTGTDTGTGKQLGAPYSGGMGGGTQVIEGTWAGNDPQAGGEAAPLGGAPAPTQTGTGWFSADPQAGGEAAPLGGAQPPSSGAGWFTEDPQAGGEAAPFGGGPAPSGFGQPEAVVNAAPPSGFLGDTGSGIPGMFAGGGLLPSAAGNLVTPQAPRDTFASRFDAAPAGQAVSPLAAFAGTPFGPSQTASFADQFAPAEPALAANQQSFGPGNFADQFAPATAALAANQQSFGPPVPGTTANTDTPPVPDSPADFATRFAPAEPDLLANQQRFGDPTQVGNIPTPRADPRNAPTTFADQFAPSEPALLANQQRFGDPTQVNNVPLPRADPRQAGGGGPSGSTGTAPAPQGGGGPAATGPAPAGAPAGAGPNDMGAVLGGDQQQRGQFDRGQRPFGGQLHNVIASMFGGGQLGDTVASLMLQLGIPAALILAASRGGGGGAGLGMLGGRAAMSGAGRGAFAPQFARNMFPGTGVPNWLIPGVAGALVGQRLDQPQQPQPQLHPPVMPGGQPGPQAPQTPPRVLTPPTRSDLATKPQDLAGGSEPGATRISAVPFGAGSAPSGDMPGSVTARQPLTGQIFANRGQAPGGVLSYIQSRGGHSAGAGAPPLDSEFASRVQRAALTYEAETGQPARFGETGRSYAQQAEYYRDFQRTGQGLAAPPGYSRHEKGTAIDIPNGQFQNWMHRNAHKFGLEGLRDPRDPNHFQMASA